MEIDKLTYKLLPSQRWILNRISPPHHWNISYMLFSEKGYHSELIKRTADSIIGIHEIFRVRFLMKNGEYYQRISKKSEYFYLEKSIEHNLDENFNINESMKIIQNKINVFSGPLFGVGLFKTEKGDHLYFVLHHLITDAYSLKIFVSDFEEIYRHYERNQPYVPRVSDSFTSLISHIYDYSMSAGFVQDRTYWEGLLNRKMKALPVDRQIDAKLRTDCNNDCIHEVVYDRKTLSHLKNELKRHGVRELHFYLSIIGMCLCDWIQSDAVLVKISNHGRFGNIVNANFRRTMGPLWVTYPVLLDNKNRDDIYRRCNRIQNQISNMPDNGRSYDVLMEISGDNGTAIDADRKIPNILFNYYSIYHDSIIIDKTFGCISTYFTDYNRYKNAVSGYEMIFNIREINNMLYLQVIHNKFEFSEETITALYNSIRMKLHSMVGKTESVLERRIA